MTTRAERSAKRRRLRKHATWGTLALACCVAAGGTTWATFTDVARVSIHDENGMEAISTQRFALGIAGSDGLVAPGDEFSAIAFDGAETLMPGGSATGQFVVFNGSHNLATDDIRFEISADDTTGIAPYLTVSATEIRGAETKELFSNVPVAEAAATLAPLAARGGPPVIPGSSYATGAEGSDTTIKVTITFRDLDDSEVRSYAGGISQLRAKLATTTAS